MRKHYRKNILPLYFAGVYCIRNTINNKKYIGSSKNIRQRWYRHLKELRGGYHHCQHLQNSWNKNGEKNFEIEVLEVVSDLSQILKCEQSWLDKTDKKTLYNSAPNASSVLGIKRSDETKRKMAQLRVGRKASPTAIHHNRISHQGELAYCATLSDNQVQEILAKIPTNRSIDLAAEYGVDKDVISGIKCGRTWKHIVRNFEKLPKFTLSKKFTNHQVTDIISLYGVVGATEIGKRFSANPSCIRRIWVRSGIVLKKNTKLDAASVKEIKKRLLHEYPKIIAKDYGVGTSTIMAIKQNITWKNI